MLNKLWGSSQEYPTPIIRKIPKVAGLLRYCIEHEHWSVFEQATMTLEITTTRGIALSLIHI